MSFLYHPIKANVVPYALSILSMGNVASIKDEKKELLYNVNRLSWLGVQLVDSTKGGVMFHNGFKSSFVINAKSK